MDENKNLNFDSQEDDTVIEKFLNFVEIYHPTKEERERSMSREFDYLDDE